MSFSDIERDVIYIDIESILDMRQGFLASKGIEFEEIRKYLMSSEYNERVTDRLMGHEASEYREAVDSGNLEVLKGSILNYNLSSIAEKSINIATRSSTQGIGKLTEIWLNTFPYEFDEEATALIQDGIFSKLPNPAIINLVNFDVEMLSPTMIEDNNIKHIYIYNFPRWLDKYNPVFETYPIKDVHVHFPPISAIEPDPAIDEIFKERGFRDGFSYLEYQYSPVMKLSFLPLLYYNNYYISKDIIEVFNKIMTTKEPEVDEELEKSIEEMINDHFSK